MVAEPVPDPLRAGRARRKKRELAMVTALTMRELGKLTAEEVAAIDHPVPVTSNGTPVAWLVPLSPSEHRRAEMIASGQLEPRRREDLDAWHPVPGAEGEPTLAEILLALRQQERA
jgi:antitoxin (DNA-binding transcriptional repressor) of toxin-antitoxin stability system